MFHVEALVQKQANPTSSKGQLPSKASNLHCYIGLRHIQTQPVTFSLQFHKKRKTCLIILRFHFSCCSQEYRNQTKQKEFYFNTTTFFESLENLLVSLLQGNNLYTVVGKIIFDQLVTNNKKLRLSIQLFHSVINVIGNRLKCRIWNLVIWSYHDKHYA